MDVGVSLHRGVSVVLLVDRRLLGYNFARGEGSMRLVDDDDEGGEDPRSFTLWSYKQ